MLRRSGRVGPPRTAAATAGPTATSSGTAPRVVVVEDEPDTAALYADVLSEAGYAVTVLGSALGARAQLQRMRPAVVVLDLGLPYRSGLSLLSELKADRATAGIPVVIVSGITTELPAEAVRLVAAQIAKPFDFDTLVDVLRGVVSSAAQGKRRRARPSELG